MTHNPCSGGSCWGKASKQRADPDPSTEVGLVPSCGSARKWTFPAELWKDSGGLCFTLSLEYSIFTHGNLRVKHHSGSYQRIMSRTHFLRHLSIKAKPSVWWLVTLVAFWKFLLLKSCEYFQTFRFFFFFFKFLFKIFVFVVIESQDGLGWKGS